MRVKPLFWLSLALLVLFFPSHAALAQQSADQDAQSILHAFTAVTQQWVQPLTAEATRLFWILAELEFCWLGIRLALRGADIQEWAAELVNVILFIGLFYALLENGSVWVGDIVQSFRQAPAAAGIKTVLVPGDVFAFTINVAESFTEKLSVTDLGTDLVKCLTALICIIMGCLIAALEVAALVESYVVIYGGVLFFGFGGSRWSKDLALKIVIYGFSVGAKLFCLELIVGLSFGVLEQINANPPTQISDYFTLVGVFIIVSALVFMVPSMVQSMVSGSSFSTASATSIAAAGAAVAAGAVGVAKAVAASAATSGGGIAAAAKDAASGIGQARGAFGKAGAGAIGAANIAGATMRAGGRMIGNLAGAARDDVNSRLAGKNFGRGVMGARMAAAMIGESGIRREQYAPRPPAEPNNSISPAGAEPERA
jgi:type IV secretion system protein TrbL